MAGNKRAVGSVTYQDAEHGYFERRIPLQLAGLEAGTREAANGCLVLRLRKSTGGARS